MNSLTGKTIWLIGASEGIGAALAARLAPVCGHLIISARNEVRLNALAAGFAKGDVSIAPLDVTDMESIRSAWNMIEQRGFMPDCVLYNAGAYVPMDAQHFDLVKTEHILDVNLSGALRVLSLVLPRFVTLGEGHIALVASVAGYRGLPGAIGYGASKAALIHLAENLKADLGQTGIKVQVINPGFVETRLTALNDFPMPCIIMPDKAADYIMRGLVKDVFEIHFPKRFSLILKLLSLLPDRLYFWLLQKRISQRALFSEENKAAELGYSENAIARTKYNKGKNDP